MKKFLYSLLIGSSFLFTSCEEVIELDLDQYEKRVAIDANIFDGEISYNKIKIYYSAPFYANSYEYITNAQVTIKHITTATEYNFSYSGNGNYENSNFIALTGQEYELKVEINGAVYVAKSFVNEAPEIVKVEQINDSGFLGNNFEVRFYYQDSSETEDFYLSQIVTAEDREFSISDDNLTNGNLVYESFFLEDDQMGTTIYYSLAKIDKLYYNYLNKLLSNSAAAGNPFSTPTGTLRGNIINTSNPNDFPLGYFNISKRKSAQYTIK